MTDWMFLLLMEAANALEGVRAEYRRTFFVDRWALVLCVPPVRTVRWTVEAVEAVRACAALRALPRAA